MNLFKHYYCIFKVYFDIDIPCFDSFKETRYLLRKLSETFNCYSFYKNNFFCFIEPLNKNNSHQFPTENKKKQ